MKREEVTNYMSDIKIYIANLAAYNAGYLKGEWVNLSEVSEDELNSAIKRILV